MPRTVAQNVAQNVAVGCFADSTIDSTRKKSLRGSKIRLYLKVGNAIRVERKIPHLCGFGQEWSSSKGITAQCE